MKKEDILLRNRKVKDASGSNQSIIQCRKWTRIKEPGKVRSLIADWFIAPPKPVENNYICKGSRKHPLTNSHKESTNIYPKETVTKIG